MGPQKGPAERGHVKKRQNSSRVSDFQEAANPCLWQKGLAEGWHRVGEGLADFLAPSNFGIPEAHVKRHGFVTPWNFDIAQGKKNIDNSFKISLSREELGP